MSKADPLMTVAELAKHAHVSEDRVRTWLKGDLPHYDLHGIRIRLSEYEAWVVSRRRTGRVPVAT